MQVRRPTISTAAEQKMMLCLARLLLLVLAAAAPVAGGLAREAGRVDPAFPAVPAAAPPGTRLWTFSARGFPVKQSPTVSNDGTMVYVGSSDNFTYAVNAADGTQIWSFNLCGGQDVQGPLCSEFNCCEVQFPPVLSSDGKVLYVGSNGVSSRHLFAVSAAHGDMIWKFTVGLDVSEFWGAPALSKDGSVLYHGDMPLNYDSNVYAVNTSDGTPLWKSAVCRGKIDFITSSPTLSNDGKTVYVGCFHEELYAINAADGKLLWTFATVAGKGTGISGASATSSIDSKVVYVVSLDYRLYAVNAMDGTQIWNFTTGSGGLTPATLSTDGKVVYIGSTDMSTYAVNALTGNQIWTFATGGYVDFSPKLSNDGNVVFVCSGHPVTAHGHPVTFHLYAIDALTGSKIWSLLTSDYLDYLPTVSSDGEAVYVGVGINDFLAVHAANGTVSWNFQTGPKQLILVPTVTRDSKVVYVVSYDGNLYAISA